MIREKGFQDKGLLRKQSIFSRADQLRRLWSTTYLHLFPISL